ncbi:hypothetical protein DL93DRAFT_2230056 [Clavulina sp. PMI_390]|nr:hypothetical protein DL93DRAFT_2230056 [Clavulina sp. PMI_390]
MALAEQGIDPGSLKDGDLPGGGGIGMTKPRRRKRRDAMDDYYDVADPFIDDSELGVDAPTHFAQTKQKGFYVNSGDVTLVLDEPEAPVKKPRKRRAFVPETPSFLVGKGKPPHAHEHPSSTGMRTVSAPSVPPVPPLYAKPESHSYPHSQSHPAGRPPLSVSVNANVPRTTGEGTRDSPIALLDGDGDEDSKMEAGDISIISMVSLGGDDQQDAKRVKLANGSARGVSASGSAGSGGMGAPPVKVEMGSPRASTINSLNGSANGNGNGNAEAGRKRKHSSVHEFSPALQASFAHLRTLVASADFTTKSKFPPQLRGPLADAAIQAVELEEYGEAFFRTLPEVFPYNKFTMTKLVKRLIYDRHTEILNKRIDSVLEKLKHAVEEGFPAAERAWRDDVAKWEEKQKRRVKADDESAASNAPTPNPAGDASAGAGKDATPPAQRYKLTDDLRNMIWHLVTINNEMAAMTNQMHEWEAQNHPAVSDQSMRKNLYQRIVGVFPEGWMNTGLISREFSNMKRKVQLADEQGED